MLIKITPTGVVNFNAKHGCQKCTTIGVYCSRFHRISFPNLDAKRRSNESFRAREDRDHHKEDSLLEKLPIDMISAFPSSDSLHLLDLGIMKRCMIRWTFGERGYTRKWSNIKINTASQLLEKCQKHMPTDIHRAVRNLKSLRKWKGLEFRTILLYVGMVVFQELLDSDEYNHFLVLCCAVRICMNNMYKSYWPIAEQMFKCYVQKYSALYGEHSVGSNVHLLIHIMEDMKQNNVQNLMELSTYKYENCLRLLGLKLKHGNLPLEQVSRRIIEMSRLRIKNESSSLLKLKPFSPQMSYPNENLLIGAVTTYKTIKITEDITLNSKKSNDSWFITKDDQIVKMKHAKCENNKYQIVGTSIIEKGHLFTAPINSTRLKIFSSDGIFDDEPHSYEIDEVASKLICLPILDKFAFIPIVHTLDSLS